MPNPIDHLVILSRLRDNRFALVHHADMAGLMAFLSAMHAAHPACDSLWLIGSDGCHLCHDALSVAELTARRLGHTLPMPVEVMDFDIQVLDILAPIIPLLVTPQGIITYPFALMDVVALLEC